MKCIKMLALAATTTAALLATAGTASATIVTSPPGTAYSGTLAAASEGAVSFHGPFTTVTCQKSTLEGKVEQHGAEVTAVAGLTKGKVTFSECNFPIKVLKEGFLEFHNITGGGDGTVTWSGGEITGETSIANCIWGTAATDIGRLTAAPTANGHATLDLGSGLPRTGHSIFCGSSATWTGSYKFNSPTGLRFS